MNEKELAKSIEILAHKIRNPLHSAVINLDVLKMKLKKQLKDQAALKHLEIADAEVKRINEILRKFFEYLELSDKERKKKNLKKYLG